MLPLPVGHVPRPCREDGALRDYACPQDEHFHVIYIDEKIVPEGWQTFMVGKTRFNDEALRQAGEHRRPAPVPPPRPGRDDSF